MDSFAAEGGNIPILPPNLAFRVSLPGALWYKARLFFGISPLRD
jgi:hypothetical protein